MPFNRSVAVAFATVLLAATPTLSEAPLRVRGNIVAFDDSSVTVKGRDGSIFHLSTNAKTIYADVIPSNFNAIKIGSNVGSAVKGPLDHLVAVEIVLVPETMRAGRVGHYAWDPLPDTSGVDTLGLTATSMTNGSVSAMSLRSTVATMTSGAVSSNRREATWQVLTVDLVGDKSVHITVPPRAPIVEFVLSDRSAIALGSTVVVWTEPRDQARLVAIGKGVTPPM